MRARTKVLLGVGIGLPVVFIGTMFVNWFVYPFTSANPNFSDVEKVYGRMVVPTTWTKLGEGANKGLRGRQCGIESDGCFSKSATFTVPTTVTTAEVETVFKGMGCISVVVDRTEPKGAEPYTDFACTSGAMRLGGTLNEDIDPWRLTVGVNSR